MKRFNPDCLKVKLSRNETSSGRSGFTLIELIVTLVILGFVAAMMVSFMGVAVTRSAEPVLQSRDGAHLHRIMDAMTADFNRLMANRSPLSAFEDRVAIVNLYSVSGKPYTATTQNVSFSGVWAGEEAEHLMVTIEYRGYTASAVFSETVIPE